LANKSAAASIVQPDGFDGESEAENVA